MGNNENQLSIFEMSATEGTLRFIDVQDLTTYRRSGENCRAKFVYRGYKYTEMSMTDPDCYAAVGTERNFGNAHIIVSLPEDSPYIKFVAAIYSHR